MAHSKGSNGKRLQKGYLQVYGQIFKIPQVIGMLGGLTLFPLSEGAREEQLLEITRSVVYCV